MVARVNYDINKYYKKHWLSLDSNVKDKLKVQKLRDSDFCDKMQEIVDPIVRSFDIILENWENPIIDRININVLINNILLMMLTDLERVGEDKKENWLSLDMINQWEVSKLPFWEK